MNCCIWFGVGRKTPHFPHPGSVYWEVSVFSTQFTGTTVVACGVGGQVLGLVICCPVHEVP